MGPPSAQTGCGWGLSWPWVSGWPRGRGDREGPGCWSQSPPLRLRARGPTSPPECPGRGGHRRRGASPPPCPCCPVLSGPARTRPPGELPLVAGADQQARWSTPVAGTLFGDRPALCWPHTRASPLLPLPGVSGLVLEPLSCRRPLCAQPCGVCARVCTHVQVCSCDACSWVCMCNVCTGVFCDVWVHSFVGYVHVMCMCSHVCAVCVGACVRCAHILVCPHVARGVWGVQMCSHVFECSCVRACARAGVFM